MDLEWSGERGTPVSFGTTAMSASCCGLAAHGPALLGAGGEAQALGEGHALGEV